MIFASAGDAFLSRGMKQVGPIDLPHAARILSALSNPFIVLGILSLIIGMASFMAALSFADLSYVLPATAISYVIMVLLSISWLHEHVSLQRWTGVAFIVVGVGIVAGGPARSEKPSASESGNAQKSL